MPRSSSGKWVARAGATGGGRTYRGQVPANWYAALVIIVILGLLSIVFARSAYQRGTVANTTPPTKGTTWFAGYDFDICGTQKAPLPANLVSATTQSFFTTGTGVIIIQPKSTTDAGTNAVLGKFISGYKDAALTSTLIQLPPKATSSSTTTTTTKASKKTSKKKASAKATPQPVTYRNGGTCPSGTKYAGKKAQVVVTYWANAFASNGKPITYSGNPATLPFTDNQLITIGFVPPGTKLPKPSGTVVTALLKASSSTTSTTTTPSSTPSSSTSTTAPGSTTTAPSSSTSTTAPGSSTTSTTAPKS